VTPDVAFVCAMPMEARPLARKLSLARATIAGLPGYRGSLGGRPVVAVVTGMGPRLAAAGAARLLAGPKPARVVVVGIAGALEDRVPVGALVVPDVVVDAATGAEHRPAPLGGLPSNGTMWTSATLVTDPGALAELVGRGVVALEMETAAVAAACEAAGTPWSVVRVISDRASDGTVDDEVFGMGNQDGSPNARAVARFVLRHPGRLPALARMGRDATRAAAAAADVAIRAVGATAS
jgi:adenosylhomocysteine nucleosidase